MDDIEELTGRLKRFSREIMTGPPVYTSQVQTLLEEAIGALTVSPEKLEAAARALCSRDGHDPNEERDFAKYLLADESCGWDGDYGDGSEDDDLRWHRRWREYIEDARAAAIALGLKVEG